MSCKNRNDCARIVLDFEFTSKGKVFPLQARCDPEGG